MREYLMGCCQEAEARRESCRRSMENALKACAVAIITVLWFVGWMIR